MRSSAARMASRRSRATRASTWRHRAHAGSRCRITSASRASTARPQDRSQRTARGTRRNCSRRTRCSDRTGSWPRSIGHQADRVVAEALERTQKVQQEQSRTPR